MKVAVLQSNYIPWKGYFDLIHDVDVFVFYDDVQFTKNDWRNRNLIKTEKGLHWLSIPVGANINRRICEVEIKDLAWPRKHWLAIMHNYSKTQWFSHYEAFFQEFYLSRRFELLSDLNQFLIEHISRNFLNCSTIFRQSTEFELGGNKQDRLISLIKACGGTTYISGPAARSYIDPAAFEQAGIELIYKSYEHYQPYPQRFPPFEHGVSIIDLLFNCGPDSPKYIWGGEA